MYILNGRILEVDVPFEHNDVLYPPSWIRLSTAEDRTAIGIKEVNEIRRPDDRFYFVQNNADGTFVSLPKDIEQIKQMLTSKVKNQLRGILSDSDWRVIKAVETGEPMAEAWQQYRNAVRQVAKTAIAQIAALTTVSEAEHWVMPVWPTAPN